MHKWGHDLANMDEARDRAVVELNRLDTVQGLVCHPQGINKREVRLSQALLGHVSDGSTATLACTEALLSSILQMGE